METGFLAHLCEDWERQAFKGEEKGAKVSIMHFGVVLGKNGGALAQMIPAFKCFAGGPLLMAVKKKENKMTKINLKGNPIETIGKLPAKDTMAPDFCLVNADLTDVTLGEYKGKTIVLNIFPSLDTPVCAASVRRFNHWAACRIIIKGRCYN